MDKKKLVVVDAPSNLGLSPPADGVIPGCYKFPWALRNRNLLSKIEASDGGCVIPPRYESKWEQGDGDRNADAIAEYSRKLADRFETFIDKGQNMLVLGGDCSVLIGSMLALKRKGRYGLVFIDAHSDFRHPGNSKTIRAAAGEDLAIVTGRGDNRLINLEGLMPYVFDEDIHIVGVRPFDEYLDELKTLSIKTTTSDALISNYRDTVGEVLKTVSNDTDGFWIHLDCDVIDKSEMPAVDCPETGGPTMKLITDLVSRFLKSPQCVGMEITIFDPDLDPNGVYADSIIKCLIQAFSPPHSL